MKRSLAQQDVSTRIAWDPASVSVTHHNAPLQERRSVLSRGLASLLTIFVSLCSQPALAHKPSDSYLRLMSDGDTIAAEWDIAVRDLEFLIGLDADQNGDITWGELKAKRDDIGAHALSRLSISTGGQANQLQFRKLRVTQHSDGAYAVLDIKTDVPAGASALEVDYRLLFDVDPTHRGLVVADRGGAQSTFVLSPSSSVATIPNGGQITKNDLLLEFAQYVREGVWHIWIGFDHILFLLCLLLPAVLRREDDGWRPVESLGDACKSVLKIVTVFTLAHSITLWLAVMDYASPPSRFIEATIAFSIVVTAINNLRPTLPISNWVIAFFFGLIHGFGFANVLTDLGLSNSSLAVALFGFNVGVELGQAAIVLAFLPIAHSIRGTTIYYRLLFQAGSAAIALIATVWMCERMFQLDVPWI